MKKIAPLFVLFFLLTACSTVKIYNSQKMPPIKPTVSESNKFFIGGIGQENIIDVRETCGNRGYMFKTYYSFLDGFLAVITFGIYTPSTYEIYCDKVD